jgi:hypothetical protein
MAGHSSGGPEAAPLQRAASEPEDGARHADAGVGRAAHHEEARQLGEPRLGHVQAEPLAGPLACLDEPHQVGLGAAGDEAQAAEPGRA